MEANRKTAPRFLQRVSLRQVGLKELWTLKWASDYDRQGPWTKAGGVDRDRWPQWMRDFKDY